MHHRAMTTTTPIADDHGHDQKPTTSIDRPCLGIALPHQDRGQSIDRSNGGLALIQSGLGQMHPSRLPFNGPRFSEGRHKAQAALTTA